MNAPNPDRRRELLDKISEYLEAAQAITDEIGEGRPAIWSSARWMRFGRLRGRTRIPTSRHSGDLQISAHSAQIGVGAGAIPRQTVGHSHLPPINKPKPAREPRLQASRCAMKIKFTSWTAEDDAALAASVRANVSPMRMSIRLRRSLASVKRRIREMALEDASLQSKNSGSAPDEIDRVVPNE